MLAPRREGTRRLLRAVETTKAVAPHQTIGHAGVGAPCHKADPDSLRGGREAEINLTQLTSGFESGQSGKSQNQTVVPAGVSSARAAFRLNLIRP